MAVCCYLSEPDLLSMHDSHDFIKPDITLAVCRSDKSIPAYSQINRMVTFIFLLQRNELNKAGINRCM